MSEGTTPSSETAATSGTTELSKADKERGRLLFARDVDFMRSAVSLETLPPPDLPEVCFAGRSNVGKSSLINALTNRKGLARASNTPGRTRELNYFNVDGRLFLVDLPGFGYAKASKTDIARWQILTRAYLRGRAGLRRVFLLIDSRHGIKAADTDVMDMLDETAVTYQIILTKTDKLKKGALDKVLSGTQKAIAKRPAAYPRIITTSSEKKSGLDNLRAEIADLALPENLAKR
jgi:GTP-binding protein